MKQLTLILAIIMIIGLAGSATAKVFSNNTADPTTDLIKRLLVEINRPLSEISIISSQIKKAEADYEINLVLLIAVMDEETRFPGFADAHIYRYNVDRGIIVSHDKVKSLPSPFSDIDCVARALANQMETFDNDPVTAVAAYFFGAQMMKHHTVDELDENGTAMLQRIMDFIRNNPDNRPNATPITSSVDSKISNKIQLASRSYNRNPGFGNVEKATLKPGDTKLSTTEEKYIAVMRYFNKSLDERTADEIYWSIAALHTEYPNVDARLVMALFAVESNFRPDAVSHKGAQGLGQLMPHTARGLNVGDAFDCSENIRGTFIYLDREFKRWEGKRYPLDLVLASYNAGPEAVKKYNNNIPPFKETQKYVPKIINIYSQLLLEEEKEEKLLHQTRYYKRGYNANK